jgi:hypothetical protein
MAQLLMQGTNYLNFMGRYAWVAAGEHGIFAPAVTERDEPQTVIGSSMHKLVYPERFEEHVEHGFQLEEFHEHPGKDIAENPFEASREASTRTSRFGVESPPVGPRGHQGRSFDRSPAQCKGSSACIRRSRRVLRGAHELAQIGRAGASRFDRRFRRGSCGTVRATRG